DFLWSAGRCDLNLQSFKHPERRRDPRAVQRRRCGSPRTRFCSWGADTGVEASFVLVVVMTQLTLRPPRNFAPDATLLPAKSDPTARKKRRMAPALSHFRIAL